MKKKTVGAVVLGGALCFAMGNLFPLQGLRAGTNDGRHPGADEGRACGPMLEALLGRLDLTKKQNAAVADILFDDRAAITKLQKQIAGVQNTNRAKLDAILTKEQRRRLAQAETQFRQSPPGMMGPPPGEGPPQFGRGGPPPNFGSDIP